MDRRPKGLAVVGPCFALFGVSLTGCVPDAGTGNGLLDSFTMRLGDYERARSEDPAGVAAPAARVQRRLRDTTQASWSGDRVWLAEDRDDVLGESGPWRSESLAGRGKGGDETRSPMTGAERPVARAPLPGFWDTVNRDLSDWPEVFWEDTKSVYTNKSNLLLLGLAYGASLSVQESGPDATVEDSLRHGGKIKGDFRDAGGVLGNPGVHFGLAGLWYLAGQQRQDQKTYEVGTKLFRALAVTGVSTILGQVATSDRAPNGEYGTFPSGHTSSSFAFASVMDREYGPLVGVPLYALSGFIGYTRLEDREHDLSDVLMGGVLGLVIGHTIAADGEPIELFGGSVVPYVDPPSRSTGLAWVKHFR